ncbi:hypothetical protein PSHT_11231 [Puccinia striiformis]|uniref:Uncharacterized protein n=1 Tax=Puccinia striiformis TaxID=27350 RepID=A0A2S4V484_9BASI|nr:hypothetical protein PSHT_11231 [Puccinia striiformis]
MFYLLASYSSWPPAASSLLLICLIAAQDLNMVALTRTWHPRHRHDNINPTTVTMDRTRFVVLSACCQTFPSPLSPRSRMAAAQVDLARLLAAIFPND